MERGSGHLEIVCFPSTADRRAFRGREIEHGFREVGARVGPRKPR
jgi:hypothetical protein